MIDAIATLLSFVLVVAVLVALFGFNSEARGHREHLKRCAHLTRLRDDRIRGGAMKDPCSTCDGDGVLGTSPDSPPCPECMGGAETHWQCFDEETYESDQVASSAHLAAELHWTNICAGSGGERIRVAVRPRAMESPKGWAWFQVDEGGVAQEIDRPKDWDQGDGPEKQDASPDIPPDLIGDCYPEPEPIADEMFAWGGQNSLWPGLLPNSRFVALPAPFSHDDCYLEPGTMPCGTCFPAQRARWDASQGDPQDWRDVSVAERDSVRRAVNKFRALTEPAHNPGTMTGRPDDLEGAAFFNTSKKGRRDWRSP